MIGEGKERIYLILLLTSKNDEMGPKKKAGEEFLFTGHVVIG